MWRPGNLNDWLCKPSSRNVELILDALPRFWPARVKPLGTKVVTSGRYIRWWDDCEGRMGLRRALARGLKLAGQWLVIAAITGFILWIMVVSIVPLTSLEQAVVLLAGLIGAIAVLFGVGYLWYRHSQPRKAVATETK